MKTYLNMSLSFRRVFLELEFELYANNAKFAAFISKFMGN